MTKKVCIDCIHHVLSTNGKCILCKRGNWQDESITLICDKNGSHNCRGWARRCRQFERIEGGK